MTSLDLAEVRATEYPDLDSGIFFNAASHGLLPLRSALAAADLTVRRNRPGGFEEGELGRALVWCKAEVARLLDVERDEVTLAPNTSFGMNLGAALAAAGEPGTIVLPDGEFPANVYPWMALEERGFELCRVGTDALGRPDPERILERLEREDVRVLALSAVQFATGYLADLEAFGRVCRKKDILFVVDAIQGLGVVPLHPADLDIDLLASGGQKWLCSPWGSGFVWMESRHREAFDPPMPSWLSFEASLHFGDVTDYRWAFVDDGRKFEPATLGLQDYLGLGRSVELLLEIGPERVREHVHRVHQPLLEWIDRTEVARLVTPRDPARRAGIISFQIPEMERTARLLRNRGVHFAVREGVIRFAPHFYNTVAEMETVVGMLEEIVAR